eukprot:TRINITY_DN16630_c0_g1_i11.p2 TRINITY_DN16630_c0_g1~~TRINITY_DN16630_c0_g1_i11.p2  ORF type:complete len:133 (+),score=32.82 TRINITY_DN16630_c0_g1_i11:100-498(+)
MIRRPPRSTLSSSSAASDVYKRQVLLNPNAEIAVGRLERFLDLAQPALEVIERLAVRKVMHRDDPIEGLLEEQVPASLVLLLCADIAQLDPVLISILGMVQHQTTVAPDRPSRVPRRSAVTQPMNQTSLSNA